MKIYETYPAEGDFDQIELIDKDVLDFFDMFDTELPLSKEWILVKLRCVHPRSSRKRPLRSDFPNLSGHPMALRQKSVDALRQILDRHAEALPLDDENGEGIFAIHVLTVIDALDREASKVVCFSGTNRIMDIEKHVFKSELLNGVDMFRLPDQSAQTFVSQNFVDAVQKAGLVGLDFKLLWEG